MRKTLLFGFSLLIMLGTIQVATAQQIWEERVVDGIKMKCWRQRPGARCNDLQPVDQSSSTTVYVNQTVNIWEQAAPPVYGLKSMPKRKGLRPTVVDQEENSYWDVDYDVYYGRGWIPRGARVSGSFGKSGSRWTTTARDGQIRVYRDGYRQPRYRQNRGYYNPGYFPW